MIVSHAGKGFSGSNKRWAILFFTSCFLFFVIGCTNKNKIPSDVLPREEMEKVLWDMIQADRFSTQFLLKDSATKNVKLETFKMYEKVFQLHKISRDEFVRSYKYYLQRPDITKVMFDSLALRSNRQRDTLYKSTH